MLATYTSGTRSVRFTSCGSGLRRYLGGFLCEVSDGMRSVLLGIRGGVCKVLCLFNDVWRVLITGHVQCYRCSRMLLPYVGIGPRCFMLSYVFEESSTKETLI